MIIRSPGRAAHEICGAKHDKCMYVVLRRWALTDIDSLVKYANNKKIADNLRDVFPHPYTAADGIKFIEGIMDESPAKVFAIEYNGKQLAR